MWIEIECAARCDFRVGITLEEKESDAQIIEGLGDARIKVYRFLKLCGSLFILMEFGIAASERVVRLQIMRINLKSFFEVLCGRADVTGKERALRPLKFLHRFGRNEQFAPRDALSWFRRVGWVNGNRRNERTRRRFRLRAKTRSQH